MDIQLFLCLILLQGAWIVSSHSPIQLPLLENSHVKLENGMDPNHLLVIECTNSENLVQLSCKITIYLTDNTSENCSTTLTANEDMDDVELLSIHQLSNKKVMIVWGDFEPRRGTSSYYRSIFYTKRITIISMDRCMVVKTLLHRYFLGTRRRLQAVVPFDTGFDAIITCHPYYENCSSTRESYDVYGNEFGEMEALPVQLEHISALAVDRKDRSKGIFVYGTYNYPSVNVSHVVAGNVKKTLNLRTDIRLTVSHANGDGSLAICGRVIGKAKTIECTLYDAVRNRIVESRASLPGYIDIVGVRSFKSGDLLVFAIDSNVVTLIKVTADRQITHVGDPMTWRAATGKCKVRGFNEDDGNFGLVCETHVEASRNLVTKIFDLPAKLRQNLSNSTEA